MKFRIDLGEEGFKGFLIRHAEKMSLAVAVILVGVFFCLGYNVQTLPETQTPTSLQQRVASAHTYITADTWEILKEVRTPPKDHLELVKLNQKPIEPVQYALPQPFSWPPFPQQKKRRDPKLYPPMKLEVTGTMAALALLPGPTDVDDLAMMPPALQKLPETTSTSRGRSSPVSPRSGDGGLLRGYPGSGGGYPGSGGGYPGSGGYGGEYSEGMSTGASGQPRQLTETQLAELSAAFTAQAQAIPKSNYIVSVKAVVPYELQWKEFEDAFSNSRGYDLQRDVPFYTYLYVERAEVPSDEETELVWTQLVTRAAIQFSAMWAGQPEEIADPLYFDPKLALPIPPVLNQDLTALALHSEIPKFEPQKMLTTPEMRGPVPGVDQPDIPMDMPGGAGGYGGESGSYQGGAGYGTGYGYSAGTSSEGGYSPSRSRTSSYGSPSYGSSSGEYGYDGSGATGLAPLVKYKLVRFFDYQAQPGKTYRYRIKLLLLDPNRTSDPANDPSPLTLADEVVERIKQLDAAEGGIRRTYWRETDWSEPSEPIHIPIRPQTLLASGVKAGREITLPGGVKFQFSEPTGNLLAAVWDRMFAVEVPAETEVSRGSLVNFKKDAEVLHPVMHEFKLLPEYDFITNVVVVDIRGGEPLPGKGRDPMLAPGEFLILDREGNLIVQHELEDLEDYRDTMFIEDQPPPPVTEGGYGSGYESEGSSPYPARGGRTPRGEPS